MGQVAAHHLIYKAGLLIRLMIRPVSGGPPPGDGSACSMTDGLVSHVNSTYEGLESA